MSTPSNMILRPLLVLLVLVTSTIATFHTHGTNVDVDCDPCIDRTKYRIRAIVHGRRNDPFWQEMQQSMEETARDIGIDFQMRLYDDDMDSIEIPRAMATDIRNAVVLENPHALIVSVPGDSLVERALESIQDRVPIFVVNALTPFPLPNQASSTKITERLPAYQVATLMDEQEASKLTTNEMKRLVEELDSIEYAELDKPLGIYINHEPGIPLLTHRYNLLVDDTADIVEWEIFELMGSQEEIQYDLTSLFEGCNYTVVQLAGETAVEATMNALADNGCDQESMIVGVYDTGPLVNNAIATESINFAIEQRPRYQGSMSVPLASMYATTGQTLTDREGEMNHVDSGPTLITADNLPSDASGVTRREKSTLNIKVLTHDLVADPFWETVYAGLQQASSDFGVNLVTHRFKSAVTGRGEVSLERSFFVREACRTAEIDGLIVSLPHDGMADALSVCHSRGIPVIAINAAPELMISDDLPYVGQDDYQSGFEAGKVLISNGVLHGYCLVHADLSSLKQRCRGMEDAFAEDSESEYKGIINVSVQDDNTSDYRASVGSILGSGSWADIGVLSTGQIQIPALLSLLQEHPELKAGTFDWDSSFHVNHDQLLFSVDQQPYMQGYLSLAMTKWRVNDPAIFTNTRFNTGPEFVFSSPSKQRRRCQQSGYNVCKPFSPLKVSGKCAELGRPCNVCEGDCDDDSNCAEGLVCFVRDSKTLGAYQDVPGCSNNPVELNAKDFCVDSSLYTCENKEPFRLRPSDGQGFETCDFVARDLSRCTLYGIYCRETCGYCRPRPPAP